MKKLFAALALLLSMLSLAVNAQQTKDTLNIRYGELNQQHFDLYLPAAYSNKTPVLLMIHGGAWVMGGNEYTEKTSKDLRNRGFIVANIDYRYVSDSVHAKDLLADIDKALMKIKSLSKTYHFDMRGFHIAGISAGAHLSLLYGYTTRRKVYSITALCAPTRLDDPEMISALAKNNLVHNIELLANAKWQEGSKAFTAVSPYAHAKNIPTILFHGDKDDLVPISQSAFLYNTLQKKKIESRFIIMPGKGHDVGMNQTESEARILKDITEWINVHDR